jgi:isopenicillin N synthase-like dioxygenase
VLATVADGFVGGRSARQLSAASSLDAFCYVRTEGDGSGGCLSCAAHTDACALTLLVADAPGLECRDGRTGAWSAVPLGVGQVAVLSGRGARSLGLRSVACEHRVRCPLGGAARTAIAVDFYATSQDLVA